MKLYPAQFEEELSVEGFSDGFVVTFRDVLEANTQGDTFIEAVEMAQDALRTAMEFYDERGDSYPVASDPQHGDVMIELKGGMSKLIDRLRYVDEIAPEHDGTTCNDTNLYNAAYAIDDIAARFRPSICTYNAAYAIDDYEGRGKCCRCTLLKAAKSGRSEVQDD